MSPKKKKREIARTGSQMSDIKPASLKIPMIKQQRWFLTPPPCETRYSAEVSMGMFIILWSVFGQIQKTKFGKSV